MVRGSKRDAQRLAAQLEVGPGGASPAGRKVEDVLDAWIDQNIDTWAPASARDQQSRVRSIKQDKIARIPIAQLSIADVERWHTRLRRAGMQDAGIRNQHGALSAAFGQAVRWGWVSQNRVALAQRKTSKKRPRGVMSLDDVRAVIAAAESFDPAAALALRIAAMTGARRAELAALQWADLDDDGMLTIDSAIEVIRHENAPRELHDAPSKTANARRLTVDPTTHAAIWELRREREPYGPWMFGVGEEMCAPDRMVVDAGAQAVGPRQEVAPPRPAPLVGDRCDRPGPRCPHRRESSRSLQPGHDPPRLRPRLRRRRPEARRQPRRPARHGGRR
jgi:hypothetical protein